jgi:hypothetical protein
LYYFTSTSQIQVLSPSSGTWQTPISLTGTTSSSQLLAISESPNGSLLAVADFGGAAIFVLDPDSPAQVTRYPIPTGEVGPAGLAVLDDGDIYFSITSGGGSTFNKLSTSSGQFVTLWGASSNAQDSMYIRVLLSPDQTKVYCEGSPYWIDTTTDTVNTNYLFEYIGIDVADGAVSADGSTVFVSGYLTDALMNPESAPVYIDWETWLPAAVYGQKLNQDGSILHQPLTDGIDMIERNTGRLLYRVQLPGTVATVYDSLLLGATPGTLGYITSSGVTFFDVSGLSIPSSASTPFSAARSAMARHESLMDDRHISKPPIKTKRLGPKLRHIGAASNGPHY